MQIRRATEADIPAMHEIRMSVLENALADPSRIGHADYAVLLREDGSAWVAEADGDLTGFAIADMTGPTVWALFVDPNREGCGIGRSLHDTMMESLFESGVEQVSLTTDAGTRAASFYESAGWEITGIQENGELGFQMTRERWSGRGVTSPLSRSSARRPMK